MGIFDRWAREERKKKEQTRHSPLELLGIKNDALLEVVAAKDTTIKALKVGIMAWEKSVRGIIDMEQLGLVEKPKVKLDIPKGADISDILENLVSEGEFEIPFLGKKGKGMIVSMIRKNKVKINEKAEALLENAMENAQNPEELSKEVKEDMR